MKLSDAFVLISAGETVTGNVRSLNEDALLDLQSQHIWAVADGMGGHQSGDFASNLIVQTLSVVKQESSLENTINSVIDCLNQVNAFLTDEAAQRSGEQTIGSTVVVFIAYEDQGSAIWMGDSRLYRLRDNVLEQLTEDHSRVQELINTGAIEPSSAESHPLANIITRAIGASENLKADRIDFEIQANDTFLLCSDGLYREIQSAEMATLMNLNNCQEICSALINFALQGDCKDNATALIIKAIPCDETVILNH